MVGGSDGDVGVGAGALYAMSVAMCSMVAMSARGQVTLWLVIPTEMLASECCMQCWWRCV